MKITNPATGKLLKDIPEDNAHSVKEKAERARGAQPQWAALPLADRIKTIANFRESLVRDTERLAAILTSEVGKPIRQSRNELNGTLLRIDFFVEQVSRVLATETVFSDPDQKLEERIGHEPLGTIANISAWNYPYFVGANVFLPALLTGNTVLYKPSEFATLTGLEIASLLHEAGVPETVFVPVIGTGKVGAELLKQPIDGVFFTGSYRTGHAIAEAVGPRMIRMQLELGGKDPIYATEAIDVVSAAGAIADGVFYNTGQSCCSVERVYVHEKVYDAFLAAFVAEVKQFKVGDPTDEKTYIGPLTRQAQIPVLEAQVKDALKKGAHLVCGGKRITGKESYFEPTVLVDVNHTMEVMREESFGPIIGIQKVKSDEEATALMNDTQYGLTAGVYTRDRVRAEKILSQVNAGSAYWNCCDRVSPRLPWSGRGHSGIGCTLSRYGIEAFLKVKAWHLRQ